LANLEPEDLDVWKLAMQLATDIYKRTRDWPKEERYGLTSQVRRAIVSVSANIAEGQHRGSTTEFIHFLRIARGSLGELRTLMRIATNVGYLTDMEFEKFGEDMARCMRMLAGLMKALERRKAKQ
jgi:four helix bundle protein